MRLAQYLTFLYAVIALFPLCFLLVPLNGYINDILVAKNEEEVNHETASIQLRVDERIYYLEAFIKKVLTSSDVRYDSESKRVDIEGFDEEVRHIMDSHPMVAGALLISKKGQLLHIFPKIQNFYPNNDKGAYNWMGRVLGGGYTWDQFREDDIFYQLDENRYWSLTMQTLVQESFPEDLRTILMSKMLYKSNASNNHKRKIGVIAFFVPLHNIVKLARKELKSDFKISFEKKPSARTDATVYRNNLRVGKLYVPYQVHRKAVAGISREHNKLLRYSILLICFYSVLLFFVFLSFGSKLLTSVATIMKTSIITPEGDGEQRKAQKSSFIDFKWILLGLANLRRSRTSFSTKERGQQEKQAGQEEGTV